MYDQRSTIQETRCKVYTYRSQYKCFVKGFIFVMTQIVAEMNDSHVAIFVANVAENGIAYLPIL